MLAVLVGAFSGNVIAQNSILLDKITYGQDHESRNPYWEKEQKILGELINPTNEATCRLEIKKVSRATRNRQAMYKTYLYKGDTLFFSSMNSVYGSSLTSITSNIIEPDIENQYFHYYQNLREDIMFVYTNYCE